MSLGFAGDDCVVLFAGQDLGEGSGLRGVGGGHGWGLMRDCVWLGRESLERSDKI